MFFAVLFLIAPALAQAPALDTGIDYAKATGLVDTDIRIIIARIINVALGLLGIVALVLVIWGGYEYMTAAGDEEQIGKAKKILLNAGIGLAIILSAYAITQFVISKLTDAIMAQYQEQVNAPGEPTNCVGGQCYSNTAFYATVEPQGQLPLKNIIVTVNFKEEPGLPAPVDKDTAILENIKIIPVISKAGTADELLAAAPYTGFLQFAPSSGNSVVEFHPTGSCAPEQPDTLVCFEKNTTYKVILSPNIKEAQISGLLAKNLDCKNHACSFYFTSGEKFDNTPPQAAMVLPGNNSNLQTDVKTTVSAMASDDAGLQGAVFHSSKEKVPFFNLSFNAPYPLSVDSDQLKYENFIPQLTDVSKKETWQLSVDVKDLAGHSTLAQQSVNVLPASCFNTVQDADETGINCGPSCGACVDEDCGANSDCNSGYCDLPAKKCAVKTKITNVDPKDGATGNYVSIFGQGFGTFESGKSQVIFLGDISTVADDKIATTVQCAGQFSWQDDFIVVQVPVSAISGPIKVISAASTDANDLAHQDSTHDDFGPAFPITQVFVVNQVVKPGICGLKPNKGAPKKSITISGANFGSVQGSSKVKFGNFDATVYTSWSDSVIVNQVPSVPAQKLTVKAVVGNQSSNSAPFEILAPATAPHIDLIDPVSGPKGGYITIYGSNFGAAVGNVIFGKNNAAYKAEPLPNECGSGWSDTQIVVKVPTDPALTDGNAAVKVFANDGIASDNSKGFEIDSEKKQINFCKIAPNNGPAGQPVILYGDGFEPVGKKWGNVDFSPFDTFAESSSWSDKKIETKVPAKVQSGPVKVVIFGDNLPAPAPSVFPLESNSLNFKVQNCQEEITNKGQKLEEVCGEKQQCCPLGYCLTAAQSCAEGIGVKSSVFAWSFSPGKLPVVPEVVVACGKDIVPSPTPSQSWEKADQVCVNAEIKVRFTTLIDSTSILGSMVVDVCDNEACANPTPVQGEINYNLSNIKFLDDWMEKSGDESVVGSIQDTLTFKPTANNGLLEQNKWYRVTLTTDIKSEVLEAPLSGANMLPAAPGTCVDPAGKKASYCFKFKTQNSDKLCKLGQAVVSPDPFIAKEYNKTYQDLYNVTATAYENKCWSINASAYDWQWNAGAQAGDISDYADLSKKTTSGANKGAPVQDLITKNKETSAGGGKVWVRTTSDNSDNNVVKDDAVLYISPKKPKITGWWPQCETACPNAAIGAAFDMDMDLASFTNAVLLTDCGTGDQYKETECHGQSAYLSAQTSPDNPTEFIFSPADGSSLSSNHWYRVKLLSSANFGVKSVGGGELDKDTVLSWHFRVKNDPSVCTLDHVNIFPASSTVYWIGDYADYLALPFGAPDNCSPLTGQMLVADAYNWNWLAVKPEVAKIAQSVFDPTNGLFNALASSTAVGNGAVNSDKQQVTQISTTAESKTSAPLADFILQCGFSPVNAACPVGGNKDGFGIGKNSCCYARPTVELIQPSVTTSVCPNTALTLKFSQLMDVGTFSSSTVLGYFNIILAQATSTLSSCPSGTFQVAKETKEPSSWWGKISAWFKKLIGQPAEAEIYCAGGVDYTLLSKTIKECPTLAGCAEADKINKTQTSLVLKNPLAGGTNYKIAVSKDVKNVAGVSLQMPYGANLSLPYSASFKTKDKLCEIDNIKIDPEAWWFNTTKPNLTDDDPQTATFDTINDKDKAFFAHAYYKTPGVPDLDQEIEPFPGAYDWTYNWASSDASIVKLNTAVGKEIVAEVAVPAKNGLADIGANATVLTDQVQPSTVGKVVSATSTVQVFICENPWPSAVMHPTYGLGYVDAEGNGNSVAKGQGWSNFKLLYCRDAGAPNDTSDDLPLLNMPTVLTHQIGAPLVADGTGIFKEFFASFAPANKNSVGLRVYSNADHLSLMDWYKSQKLTGAPTPAQVGSYKALQEGRTYYVDGVNSSGTNLYSNVYVFSFSDNPTAETLNIVNQLLSNLTLNVNVPEKETVAKMYRDYQRLQDLKLISDKLWSYYGKKGEYPKLTENPQLGTYLPAYTNSKWKSWQGVLGNLVGYTLPVDPLNGFKGCGSSTKNVGTPPPGVNLGPFDAETCWNAANSTFVCPKGSQVYQYSTMGGVDAWLKADFELANDYQWFQTLNGLKPANTIYFGTADQCDDVVKGIGGKCGDGIVGIYTFQNPDGTMGAGTEICEIGQTKDEICAASNGYPGMIKKKCDVNCLGWLEYDANGKKWATSGGTCLPQGKCGDGVKQGTEACDDGKNNGKYGYCQANCLGTSIEFCGDNVKTTGKEVCDSSSLVKDITQGWCKNNQTQACNFLIFFINQNTGKISSASGDVNNNCPNDECVWWGAKYNKDKNFSCSWDCQTWDYCGDGVVNQTKKVVGVNQEAPYEECEESKSCQVGTCSSGPQKNKYCGEDKDCWNGVGCYITTDCLEYKNIPFVGPICVKWKKTCSNNNSLTCSDVSDCTKNITCDNKKLGKKYCKVTGEKKYIKFINSVNKPYFQDATTTASVNPTGELSYTDSNKNCGWEKQDVNLTNFATLDVSCLPTEIPPVPPSPSLCGNGKIEAGEVCDDGANNGVKCQQIGNAKTCTYCEYGCQQVKTLSFP